MGILNKPRLNILFKKRRPQDEQDKVRQVQGTFKFGAVLPTEANCITHLKLLTAFAYATDDVVQAAGQIARDYEDGSSKQNDHDDPRWTQYVNAAATRFQVWWETVVKRVCQSKPATLTVCLAPVGLEDFIRQTQPLIWTDDLLPPLDVLMVLHTFMLNPRSFLEDCLRQGTMPLWKAGFPWRLVDQAASDKYTYEPMKSARIRFEEKTGLSWVPEATQDRDTGVQSQPERYLSNFASIKQLKKDISALLEDDIPLPGTILGVDGLAQSKRQDQHIVSLNSIFRDGSGKDIVDKINSHLRSQEEADCLGLNEIESLVNGTLLTRYNVESRRRRTATGLPLEFDAALNHYLSKYKNNTTQFSLNLADAVLRQDIFVRKMQEFDWIHSPGVETVVAEALPRYAVFFQIMATNYGRTAVPTYDVDLCWHTHQLQTKQYYDYSVAVTKGVFIDHDDKIGKGALFDYFAWTCEQFSELTGGEVYDECLCWLCFLEPTFGGHSRSSVDVEQGIAAQIAPAQRRKFEEDFARATRHAIDAGKQAPNKEDFKANYSWKYPRYKPERV